MALIDGRKPALIDMLHVVVVIGSRIFFTDMPGGAGFGGFCLLSRQGECEVNSFDFCSATIAGESF